jgi:hypothetical protein
LGVLNGSPVVSLLGVALRVKCIAREGIEHKTKKVMVCM